MLKITSRNEKLNCQMKQKETTYLLHKLFSCFFVSLNISKNFRLINTQKKDKSFRKTKTLPLFKQPPLFVFQFQRYFINWQSQMAFRFSFTKVRSICFLTGRSRSVYRAFRLSRLKIREYAALGYFTGLSKASW